MSPSYIKRCRGSSWLVFNVWPAVWLMPFFGATAQVAQYIQTANDHGFLESHPDLGGRTGVWMYGVHPNMHVWIT
eukprot:186136-Chlamydomonas_euryale.AAC.1